MNPTPTLTELQRAAYEESSELQLVMYICIAIVAILILGNHISAKRKQKRSGERKRIAGE